jgi:hypothetical protein
MSADFKIIYGFISDYVFFENSRFLRLMLQIRFVPGWRPEIFVVKCGNDNVNKE